MTVTDVLEYLAAGMTEQEILAGFPDLTSEDIKACLAFAADRERTQLGWAILLAANIPLSNSQSEYQVSIDSSVA